MYGLIAFIGILSIIAPFAFGYQDNQPALWTNLILGFVLASVSIFERLAHNRENWEYWIAGLVGGSAILAPFLLGFYTNSGALLATMIVGFAAVLAAGFRLSGKPPRIST